MHPLPARSPHGAAQARDHEVSGSTVPDVSELTYNFTEIAERWQPLLEVEQAYRDMLYEKWRAAGFPMSIEAELQELIDDD